MKSTNKVVSLLLAVPLCSLLASANPTKHPPTGERLFKQYCANCHLGGGNRVKDNHPIAGSKMLTSIVSFRDYLKNPPGHMPYYQSLVKDQDAMDKLYSYCKSLPPPPVKSAENSQNELDLDIAADVR